MKRQLLWLLLIALLLGVLSLFIVNSRLRKDLATATSSVQELQSQIIQLKEENDNLSQAASVRTEQPSESQHLELMRLRNQVGLLNTELTRAKQTNARLSAVAQAKKIDPRPAGDRLFNDLKREPIGEEVEIKNQINWKETQMLGWWLALQRFAADHDGKLPATVEEARSYLSEGIQDLDWQNIRYIGATSMTNLIPQSVIFREHVPSRLSDGLICNPFLMGDGSFILLQTQ